MRVSTPGNSFHTSGAKGDVGGYRRPAALELIAAEQVELSSRHAVTSPVLHFHGWCVACKSERRVSPVSEVATALP